MLSSLDERQQAPAMGHLSVLLNESVELLAPISGARILDGTFGGGGHTTALLEAAEGVTVVALDRDPEAVVRASELKKRFGDRFQFRAMNFGDLAEMEPEAFDGALFDFGLSSFQLDDACLLYTSPSPRDMRRSRMPSSA